MLPKETVWAEEGGVQVTLERMIPGDSVRVEIDTGAGKITATIAGYRWSRLETAIRALSYRKDTTDGNPTA